MINALNASNRKTKSVGRKRTRQEGFTPPRPDKVVSRTAGCVFSFLLICHQIMKGISKNKPKKIGFANVICFQAINAFMTVVVLLLKVLFE
jgi:hypothetical protein